MKKILIFVLIAIFSRCDNDEYSSFSEYLENSVYVEKGTNESGGKIYKWENYHTFDFSKYGYKQNGFREVSECYSTGNIFENGQIISDTDSSVTYVQGGTTLTISKLNSKGIKFQTQYSSGGGWTYNLLKSDFSTLESLKAEKRSDNSCY